MKMSMGKTIQVALAGVGAFGLKHLDGIKNIPNVKIVSLIGREPEKTNKAAAQYGVGHTTTDLAESLAINDLDAVILCTPTQMHAAQTSQCLRAGKHVQVEIPLADSLAGAQQAVGLQKQTGRHVRPYSALQSEPSVCSRKDSRRRVQHSADGCADLFFPAHKHECTG